MFFSPRTLFVLAVIVAVAAPAFRGARDDSYPLSTYPMFARVLDKPLLTVALGVTRSGQTVRLPPRMVANSEPMQAMRTLRLTANDGKRALKSLCARIAARVADTSEFSGVRRVRIVRARFDPLGYFEGVALAEEAERLTQCRVPGAR